MIVPSSSTSTTPNGGADLRDDDRPGGAARLVFGEERAKVDVEQLVAVEREHGPCLLPPGGREPEPAAAAERLVLPHRVDLGAEPGQGVCRNDSSSPARHATITRVTPDSTSRATP